MQWDGYAVLWDMDGVLVDSGSLHRRAWRLYLAQKGHPVTDEIFDQGFGQPNEQVLPVYFGDTLAPEAIRQMSEEKEACYRDLVRAEGIVTTPGVLDWLPRFAAAGLRQGLATSGCRANAEFILDLTGTRRYFATVVAAEDVPRGKPHPDVFLRTAAELGVPPERCVVIEDSRHGIAAARAAGMRVVALATTHAVDEIEGADVVLQDLLALTWSTWEGLFLT